MTFLVTFSRRAYITDRSKPTLMRSILTIVFITFSLVSTYSQKEEVEQDSTQKIIDETIWKPFKTSYEARDWLTFNALHTDDILRVHDGGIRIGEEYKKSNTESYQRPSDRKVTIDFAMERRMHASEVGYEVGFYRVRYTEPGKEDRMSYGRFHVVLRKIQGKWRIAQDWDSNSFNGNPIGADDFDKAQFLDLSD